jgi:APA family basic amino acid/polyamine antiporter
MPDQLKRAIKTPGAIFMGLGSIIGTGVFVSIAIATQIAGSGVLFAILIAAVLAIFNGLSSAQLAANYPVSGGTYEYGYQTLGHWWGFSAGWMFVVAKTASAATAALGCAGYIIYLFGLNHIVWLYPVLALSILLLLTILVSGGISRSNRANTLIVIFTIFGLTAFIIAAFFSTPQGFDLSQYNFALPEAGLNSILMASALMIVAYTGYGRIATLGEEVIEPRKTIPKAIILSLTFIAVLYLLVAISALTIMGAELFGDTIDGEAAPLMMAAQAMSVPGIGLIVSIAAITAMMGVLLNLLLGISRVILAMGRRGDVPVSLSKINPESKSPVAAVWVTGFLIGMLVLTGDIKLTWSFSAFTVLIYYSITNLSALMLKPEQRLYPVFVPIGGLTGCLFLAFWLDPQILVAGILVLTAGWIWHFFRR